MAETEHMTLAGEGRFELGVFSIGEALFGIDIREIEEINKVQEMSKVPQAPGYVLGLTNLRGRIVTIIDLGRKLDLEPCTVSKASRNIIIKTQDDSVGLLVERVGDVVPVDPDRLSPPPANIRGVQGKFLRGVLQTEEGLIAILDVERVLEVGEISREESRGVFS